MDIRLWGHTRIFHSGNERALGVNFFEWISKDV